MSHKTDSPSYRSLLLHELERRCRHNARYSLRAFARDLDMYPSRLSEVINGKKGLSTASAQEVARCLNWSESEKSFFVTLVEAESSRHPKVRAKAKSRLRNYKKTVATELIPSGHFEILGDWVHLAMLELLKLPNMKSSAKWMAARLGLTPIRVELALSRLIRLGYIEEREGRYHDASADLTTPEIPSQAIRDYHHQILKKADETLETCALEEREYAALTMAIDSSRLPEAKKELQRFRRKFASDLEKSGAPDRVYCLALQLFPIDQKEPLS